MVELLLVILEKVQVTLLLEAVAVEAVLVSLLVLVVKQLEEEMVELFLIGVQTQQKQFVDLVVMVNSMDVLMLVMVVLVEIPVMFQQMVLLDHLVLGMEIIARDLVEIKV